jgi:hypothetical protein
MFTIFDQTLIEKISVDNGWDIVELHAAGYLILASS